MSYKSDAQRKFFNANRVKLEAQGVDVDEYNAASKGMDLPEHAPKMRAEMRSEKRNSRARKSKYDFLKRDRNRGPHGRS